MMTRNILEKGKNKGKILNIGEKVLVLAEKIKKNLPLGNFISNLTEHCIFQQRKNIFHKKKEEN